MKNMDRIVKIPSLNNGNEFEFPRRKVKHTKYVLENTLDTPEILLSTEQNILIVYAILKDKFNSLKKEDIENLEEHELVELTFIAWDNEEMQKVIEKFRKSDGKGTTKQPKQK